MKLKQLQASSNETIHWISFAVSNTVYWCNCFR